MAENGVSALASEKRASMFEVRHPAKHCFKRYKLLIFDLSVILEPVIEKKDDKQLQHTLYDVLHSRAWFEFEKDRMSLPDFHLWLQDNFRSSSSEDMGRLTETLLKSRILKSESVEIISRSAQTVNVHILGNIPLPVWSTLRPALAVLSPTSKFHTSCELGCRLPYSTIFEQALKAPTDPQEDVGNILFVTASVDAHISARATGLSTLLLRSDQPFLAQIAPFLRDPLPAAKSWLQQRAGFLNLTTSISSVPIRDTYIQLLILELTGNEALLYPELLDPDANTLKFSWFVGPRPVGIWDFPPDLDCTSLAYLNLPRLVSWNGLKDANTIMDEILQYQVEETGLLNTYLDHDKLRLDLIALANTLALFYSYGRGNDVQNTRNFLLSVLHTGAYEEGSHYYTNPNVFLFAVSRLLVLYPLPLTPNKPSHGLEQLNGFEPNDETEGKLNSREVELQEVRTTFSQALRGCIHDYVDTKTDALGLACRIIAGARCGIRLDSCLNKLLALQQEDGSWPACVIYKFNRRDGVCWHQGLTVALAVKAIEDWDKLR